MLQEKANLYVKEGTEDLLIISYSAELMKLQLASQILPCLYQHVVGDCIYH